MSNSNNIDDLFREHQNDWAKQPNSAAWEKLTSRLDDKAIQKSKRTIIRWLGAACIVALLGIGVALINQSISYESDIAVIQNVAIPPAKPTKSNRLPIEYNFDSSLNTKPEINTFKNEKETTVSVSTTPSQKENVLKVIEDAKTIPVEISKEVAEVIEETTTRSTSAPIAVNDVIDSENEEDFEGFSHSSGTGATKLEPSLDEQLEDLTYKDDVVFANRASSTFKKEEYEAFKEDASDKQKKKKEENTEKAKKEFDEKDAALPAVAYANESNIYYDKKAKEAAGKAENKKANQNAFGYATDVLEKTITIKLPLANKTCDTASIFIANTSFKINGCTQESIDLLSKNKFLANFYTLKIPELKTIGKIEKECDFANYIQIPIIVEYGLVSEPQTETILWQYDLNCNDNALKKYVSQFYNLIGE